MIKNSNEKDVLNMLEGAFNVSIFKYSEQSVLGTFLFGSQNYNLDTENSDVDVVTILVPSIYDIAIGKKPISETFDIYDSTSKIVAKDIREMLKMWQKQSINFTEILFTPYGFVNRKYAELWKEILQRNREIANWNRHQLLCSISGMLRSISSKPMNGKQYVNVLRLIEFLKSYSKNEPYEKALKVSYDFREMNLPIKLNKNIIVNPNKELTETIETTITELENNPMFRAIDIDKDDSYGRLLTELGIIIKNIILERG